MTITAASAPTTRTVTQSLAREGLKNIDGCQHWDSARRTGDEYLSSIIRQGDTPGDRTVALVTQNAGAAYLTNRNAGITQIAGLQALSAGIAGPLGVAIASVASQALDKADRWDDARTIGNQFTEALSKHAESPLERLLAQVGRQASGEYVTNQNGFHPNNVAVKMIARGVAGKADEALAQLADVAVGQVNRWDDARTMGYVFLKALAEHSTEPENKAVAETALKASGQYLTDQEGATIQINAYREILR